MSENTQLIRVPVGTSANNVPRGELVVEVPQAFSGVVPAARPGDIAATATRTLTEGFDNVRHAAEALLERLGEISRPPHTVEMELGLKLNAEAGAVVAKTSGEGNFLIRLTWQADTA
jgi:NTP-dependent ternary system trypsin peptidase co-occuring protein